MKILVAVWGEDYIERLERFGFSSFLAPGNLPAMAQRCDVELVVLTCEDDIERFEERPLMAAVRDHASVRYIAIDDLIAPGLYSTTLTLAFMRGVAAFGEAMTDAYFVFWNADFVLSDGAFAHLADLIEEGRKVIITGTLRATAEQAEPLLDRMREDKSAPLAVSSRTLLEMVFRYLHPHHVAKTVNQDVCWTMMPSQMLWRVDEHAMLGRFFKAFMFCLRPTRVLYEINAPCDYSFVPELCPGEPQTLIQDSDDAFILELQPREAEAEFVRLGPRDENARRACMEEWLTPEHLDTGERVVILRSGDTPAAAIEAAEKGFADYFEGFIAEVAPPRSHVGQYYWTYGVAAWREHRERHRPGQVFPNELVSRLAVADLKHPTYHVRDARALTPAAIRAAARGLKGKLRVALFGPPHVARRFHPDAPSMRTVEAAANAIKTAVGADGAIIVVGDLGQWIDLAFPIDDPSVYRIEPATAAFWSLCAPPLASAAFICLRPDKNEDLAAVVDHLADGLADGAPVCIVLHDAGWKGPVGWVERQLSGGLALFGALDDLRIELHEATAADRTYASLFYEVVAAVTEDGRLSLIIPRLLRFLPSAFARLAGGGSRTPSGRPLVGVVTGRYRRRTDHAHGGAE